MSFRKCSWFPGLVAALMVTACDGLPSPALPVASVTVSPAAPDLAQGSTVQLLATAYDTRGNTLNARAIVWSSSAEAIATVTATGLVTGVSVGGPVTITAISEGQAGTAQVTVTVPAPAVATNLVPVTSVTLSGYVGTAVIPPSVRVIDQRGGWMRDVAVTFAVASGGGTVTGESATTNSEGVATVGGWVLGALPGANTLTASAAGLPSVTFTATGTINAAPCPGVVPPHVLGTTTSGSLSPLDCMSDGVFIDFYSLTLSGEDAYLFRLSAAFDTYLLLVPPTGLLNEPVIAENDDASHETHNSAIKALLPGGSYVLGASSYEWGETGAYSLSSERTSPEVTRCEEVFVVRGLATPQSIQTTDCVRANGAGYADEFHIQLTAGQPVTLSMTSTAVDAFLELVVLDPATGAPTVVAFNDNGDSSGSKDARLVYTAALAGHYKIVARTALAGQTGGYTLIVQ